MGKLEQLFGPILRGPLASKANSASGQWAGRTTLGSGATTVVISTTAVRSNCIVNYGIQASTIAASGVGKPIQVVSLSHGNYFAFGTADGIGIQQSTTIMWQILRTD